MACTFGGIDACIMYSECVGDERHISILASV